TIEVLFIEGVFKISQMADGLRKKAERLGGEFGLVVGYSPNFAIRSRNIGWPLAGRVAFPHFFASWCINPKERGGSELPPKVVQDLLAHSTISMTLDIYGHLFPSKVIVTSWRQPPSVYWAEARHKCGMAALSSIKTMRGHGLQIRGV